MDRSVLQEIALVDVWVGQTDPGIADAIHDDVIHPDRFRECFSQYPDVLVEILKITRIGEMASGFGHEELLYRAGAQDTAKKIVTLAAMEGKQDADKME